MNCIQCPQGYDGKKFPHLLSILRSLAHYLPSWYTVLLSNVVLKQFLAHISCPGLCQRNHEACKKVQCSNCCRRGMLSMIVCTIRFRFIIDYTILYLYPLQQSMWFGLSADSTSGLFQDGLFLVTNNLDLVSGYSLAVLTPNVNEYKRLVEKVLNCEVKEQDAYEQLLSLAKG